MDAPANPSPAPEWTHSRLGETYYLTLCKNVLVLEVTREAQSRDNPSPTPYAVKIFGARLKAKYGTAQGAQAAAIRAAKQFLTEAVENLDKVEK